LSRRVFKKLTFVINKEKAAGDVVYDNCALVDTAASFPFGAVSATEGACI
jgi:hypothetical protein